MTIVGLIGSGNIGTTIARLAVEAGHRVVLSNLARSRHARGGGRGTRAAGVRGDERGGGDIVVVSVPVKAFPTCPPRHWPGEQ